ncbi:hypothetical protein PUN28_015834 [Cardiocondyla obscurior]|uniref:Uncharacterized protein n=1 Tax=Cardiocondyla obscurior TaxID=286306 RepID=A0AAW2ES37_9HYME
MLATVPWEQVLVTVLAKERQRVSAVEHGRCCWKVAFFACARPVRLRGTSPCTVRRNVFSCIAFRDIVYHARGIAAVDSEKYRSSKRDRREACAESEKDL